MVEEADIILLNKVGTLDKTEEELLSGFLRTRFPGAVVIPVSANKVQSVGALIPILIGSQVPDKKSLEIDYGIYGRAEEKLGWLNSGALLKSDHKIDWNALIIEFMEKIRSKMKLIPGEIAHLKIYAVSDGDYVKASLTDLEEEISFNRRMTAPSERASLIVNARVGIEPVQLAPAVEEMLRSTCNEWGVVLDNIQTECFKPGWPTPKYRIAEP